MKNGRLNVVVEADYYIFALGGASWPVTGSTGDWRGAFEAAEIRTLPFRASNCGTDINWPENIRTSHAGKPLKNIGLDSGYDYQPERHPGIFREE